VRVFLLIRWCFLEFPLKLSSMITMIQGLFSTLFGPDTLCPPFSVKACTFSSSFWTDHKRREVLASPGGLSLPLLPPVPFPVPPSSFRFRFTERAPQEMQWSPYVTQISLFPLSASDADNIYEPPLLKIFPLAWRSTSSGADLSFLEGRCFIPCYKSVSQRDRGQSYPT